MAVVKGDVLYVSSFSDTHHLPAGEMVGTVGKAKAQMDGPVPVCQPTQLQFIILP